jgi:CBS-domain-containing membrane protein
MTLQYGLTAAPASQPRNAILGQLFALLIAHGIGQSTQLEPWFKETLAPSLAIAMMVKCGVTHPPAGAAALLFSSGTRSWPQIGMMLVGNVVAIACATVINNLSDKRKYPTFWGFRELWNWVYGDYGKDRKKKKEK